jgi:AraC-like DNA-binding protein
MTAYSFVEQVRLHHAMELLKKGTTGITQIAIDCGFYDHSAFVKRFKKFTGTTPLNYRRQHQAAFANERPIVLPTPSK